MRLFVYSLADPLHQSARTLAGLRLEPPAGPEGGAPGDPLAGAVEFSALDATPAFARFWRYRLWYHLHKVRLPRPPFPRLLFEMAQKHTLVPLDPDSAAQTAALNLDFRMPGDFLSDGDLAAMRQTSTQIHNAVWRDFPWRDHWSANWLRDDSNMMLLAVSTFALAQALGDSFEKQGMERIVYFRPPGFRQGRGQYPNDYMASVWEHRFPGAARPIILPSLTPRPVPDRVAEPLSGLPRGAILFAFVSAGAFRHFPVVQATARACGRPVVVCFSDFLHNRNNHKAIQRLYDPLGVPVIQLPDHVLDRHRRPEAAEEALLARVRECVPRGMDIEFFWRYCTQSRWPRFEAHHEAWTSLMREIRPALCIGSTLHNPESSTPMHAAKKLGIPAVAVPHAFGYQLCSWDHLDYMDALACCTKIQESFLTDSTPGAPPASSFSEIDLENQHPFKIRRVARSKGKTVLFLHSGCQCDGWHIEPWRTVVLLREIARTVPPPLRGALRMLHKVHPLMNEFGVQILAGVPAKDILYHKAHLATVLETTDVAVAVNYTRAPLLHAMLAGRPAVLLRDRRQQGLYHPRDVTFAEMLEKEGFLVADGAPALWETLQRLLLDADYYTTILEKQNAFCREQLCQTDSGWEAWLEGHVEKAGRALPEGTA